MRGTAAVSAAVFLSLAAIVLSPNLASAHITVASGPGYAGTTQEITFQVAHGCSTPDGVLHDTTGVTIEIPAAVTSLRAVPSPFGKPSVHKTGGLVDSVTWTKAAGDALATDEDFYKLTIRIPVPNAPFTTLYFVAHQTCQTDAGPIVVDWSATAANPAEDAGSAEPAPALIILPAHQPGWNKLTVPAAVTADTFVKLFPDAQIVWKGTAAYSANPNTVAQIASTAGVTALGDLAAGDVIWVKY